MRFECLEDRSLMAGNVAAAVAGGVLALTGDNSSNYLVVHQTGTNQVQVQGIATSITSGGQTRSSFTFNGVTALNATLNALSAVFLPCIRSPGKAGG